MVEVERARLGPGEREQVLHQEAETPGVALDAAYGVGLLLVELAQAAVDEHLRVAGDARDRGAQLVADVRDQVLLDVVDLDEPLHGRVLALERDGQRLLGADALGDVLPGADVAEHPALGVGHLAERQ